jgi:hypothetical protein
MSHASPPGIRNNNPGNLVKNNIQWQGLAPPEQQADPKFWVFIDAPHGIRALTKVLMTDFANGLNTVTAIISRWAPPSENDTQAYITDVAHDVGCDPTLPVDLKIDDVLRKFVEAIIYHENGEIPYDDSVIDQGIAMAQPLTDPYARVAPDVDPT